MLFVVPTILIFLAILAVGIGGYNVWVKRRTDREIERLKESGEMRLFVERLADGQAPAVLLVHGYGGSPFDLTPISQRLDSLGLAYHIPVLPGHGESPYDMENITYDDWRAAVREAHARLQAEYGRTIIVGFSMGASLALAEAAEHPPERLVLIAPYFKLYRPPLVPGSVESWARTIGIVIPVVRRMSKGNINLNDPDGLQRYKARKELAITAIGDVVESAKQARAALTSIDCPVLWLHSSEDGIADYDASMKAFEQMQAPDKKIVRFERSAHVLLFDYDAEAAVDSIIKFISASAIAD